MKVKDGIIGLVIGDALGVPVEFIRREELEKNPVTDMRGHGTYNQPAGTWSDDSSMVIATMDSIIEKQAIDYEDIMDKFCQWLYNDEYTNSDSGTFDCGFTVNTALSNYKKGIDPLKCGPDGERDNGNGSLMRILPLAFIPDIDYETVEKVSGLTHGHERSKIACALYIEIARSMLENDLTIREHVDVASEKIKEYYAGSEELTHFNRIFSHDYSEGVSAKGYVITTFESVMYALENTDSYRSAVLKGVNLGEDTDTVGAICGGLAGIYYGFGEIPVDWIDKVSRMDWLLSLCEKYEAFCDES